MSAAMRTMGSPQKWTSSPTGTSTHWSRLRWPTLTWPGSSAAVSTARTPGRALASAVSMDLMMALGYSERTAPPWSMPGRWMSSVYSATPRALAGASTRGRFSPTRPEKSSWGTASPSRKIRAARSTASSIFL